MTCAAVNWLAGWVVLAIGIGIGMFIASLFAGGSRD